MGNEQKKPSLKIEKSLMSQKNIMSPSDSSALKFSCIKSWKTTPVLVPVRLVRYQCFLHLKAIKLINFSNRNCS